jgi:hypothetical protein
MTPELEPGPFGILFALLVGGLVVVIVAVAVELAT